MKHPQIIVNTTKTTLEMVWTQPEATNAMRPPVEQKEPKGNTIESVKVRRINQMYIESPVRSFV